jgi:phage repressor protein C with HTH and peptisase S24 domain
VLPGYGARKRNRTVAVGQTRPPAANCNRPLLPIREATPGPEGDQVADLDQLNPKRYGRPPPHWCPNPRATISLGVAGNSMSPLILDGYVVAVDTSSVSRDHLVGKIVVDWNPKEKALLWSRRIRFDHTEALVSDQRGRQSILLANGSHWRIVGRVLWWAGRDDMP